MNNKNNATGLSLELAALLENTPLVKDLDLKRLEKSARELDNDPKWRAEFLKSRFVDNMLIALKEESTSQSAIAHTWGKSRQYVGKLLNEDRRVNFTIETMCEVAHLLNRTIDIPVLRKNELSQVIRCIPSFRLVTPSDFLKCSPTVKRSEQYLGADFRGAYQVIQPEKYDDSCLAA